MTTKNIINIVFVGESEVLADIELPEGVQKFVTESLSKPQVDDGPMLLITDVSWLETRSAGQRAELLQWANYAERWLIISHQQASDNTLLEWLQLGATDVVSLERLAIWVQQFCINQLAACRGKTLWVLSKNELNSSYYKALVEAGLEISIFSSVHEIPANNFPAIMLCSDLAGLILAKGTLQNSGANIPVIYLVDMVSPQQFLFPQAVCVPSSISSDHLVALICQKIFSSATAQPFGQRLIADQMIQTLDQHAIVSMTDLDGQIKYVNDRFCEISGYNRDELLGKNHNLLKSGLHDAEFYQKMWTTLTQGNTWQGVLCNRKKQDGLYWVEATIMPYIDSSGKIIGYCSVRTDVTALKESEDKIRRHSEMLRQSQNFANVGTWDWNILTGDLYWSERVAPLFGYTQGEVKTSYENFIRAVHPDDRQLVEHAISNSMENKMPYEIEHRVVWNDGQVHWVLERGAATFDKTGKPAHMLGVVQDIQKSKVAELALEQSQAELAEANIMMRQVLDTIPDRVFWKDRDLRYLGGNQAFCHDAGKNDPEELIGLTDFDMPWSTSETDLYRDDDLAVMKNNQPRFNYEEYQTVASGKKSLVRTNKIPLKSASGEVIGLLGVYQDITEAYITQQRLKENEERLSFAIEGAGDGIWDWDISSGAMTFSRLYMEMLGYEEFELPHHEDTWLGSLHPDDQVKARQYLEEYLQGKHDSYNIQIRLRCKNGGYKWILCRGTLVDRSESGEPLRMIGIHADISEQKLLEDSLNIFRQVFDSSDQCIVIADSQCHVVFANQAYAKAMNIVELDVFNHDFKELIAKDKDTTDLVMNNLFVKKRSWTGLTTRQRADSSEFVTTNGFGLVKDPAGNISNVFVIFSDFTQELERREELANAKDEAEKANNAKSEFLSSMSHELRTPMNSVIGFAQLLEYDENVSVDQMDNIKEILRAGRHLLDLINEVLDLSQIEAGRIDMSIETVDLNVLIKECCDLTIPLATQRQLSFQLDISESLQAHADQIRLKQVLLNLISNAIKYNSDGGKITISTKAVDGIVRICISDTGPGIANERLGELYQPFNRLDAGLTDIEGTGIGLIITRRLIEMMNGSIGVESQLGQGSIFWIELPMADPLPEDLVDLEIEQSTEVIGNSLKQYTVLCIDDNPANLKLIGQILSKLKSVRVLTVQEPKLGIEMALVNRPDLILVDINMPHMDGYEVVRVLSSLDEVKHVPIIAVTANAMPKDIERGLAAGFSDYLTKPLDMMHTLETVNKYLTGTEVGDQDD